MALRNSAKTLASHKVPGSRSSGIAGGGIGVK
jgi:hypothetical protein